MALDDRGSSDASRVMQAVWRSLRYRRFRRRYDFPEVRLDDLLSKRTDWTLDLFGWDSDKRAGDLFDSLIIATVARALQPELYWEIGTGAGRTALLVARNTPPASVICTLDLGYPVDPQKGEIFLGRPEAAKIRQFGGHSNRFDFGPWKGQAQLVFVDGSHQFDDVRYDCEIAFSLLRPGGWILWHDVDMDVPDVAKALKHCSRANQIWLVGGSRYAVYCDDSTP